jgi:hypothetical protein
MPPWKALMLANLKGQSQMKWSAVKLNLNMLQFLCNAFDSAAGFTTQSKPKLQRLGKLNLTTAVQGVLPPDVTKKGKKRRLSQLTWKTSATYKKRANHKKKKKTDKPKEVVQSAADLKAATEGRACGNVAKASARMTATPIKILQVANIFAHEAPAHRKET